MERLKLLLARHGERHSRIISTALCADKTDAEIAALVEKATDDEHKAALAAKDEKIKELEGQLAAAKTAATEATASNTELKAQLAALGSGGGDGNVPPAGTGAPGGKDQPKTVMAAMAQLSAAGDKRVGFALRSAALAKWPDLRKGLPKA